MTDKHIPASKLLALPKWNGYDLLDEVDQEAVKLSDLRALIDAEPEKIPLCNLWVNPDNLNYEVDHCEHPLHELIPVYAAPPSDNLIAELVQALEESNEALREGIESEMELEAEQSKYARVLCGKIDALLERAKEALK